MLEREREKERERERERERVCVYDVVLPQKRVDSHLAMISANK